MPESTEAHTEQLAVSYAALILHDEGVEITADKLSALTKAAKIDVPAYWPQLYSKALKGRNLDDLVLSAGGGGAAAPAAGGAAPAAGGAAPAANAAAAAPAAKEPEPEPEPEADMGFSLFD